jgi:leucyl aminopeptidase
MSGNRLAGVACSLAALVVAAAARGQEAPGVLARVEVAGALASFPLRVHAHLGDGAGDGYLLALATEAELAAAGWPYAVLDAPAHPGEYWLAAKRTARARAAPADLVRVLHDDGRCWVVRATREEIAPLRSLGFAVRSLPREPLVLAAPPPVAAAGPRDVVPRGTPDARVSEIVAGVTSNGLHALMRRLTGAEATVAAGTLHVFNTRTTVHAVAAHRATQAAYDHMAGLGLDVRFENWTDGGWSGRNVVATQPGTTRSNEIVVVVAHLDSYPESGNAPGADDNASGAAAVLTAAGAFRRFQFERTVRFLLVTGEEQDLCGSTAHAATAKAAGQNLVAVWNMDMLAWDSNGDGAVDLHVRKTANAGYAADLALAQVFTNAVATYGWSGLLRPQIDPSGEPWSDHAPFWANGYAAVLAIEDYDDFNEARYHTASDTLASLAAFGTHYVRFVQACLATVAELARPAGRVAFDAVEIATAAGAPAEAVGASQCSVRHEAGATESGTDGRDATWASQPANTNARSLAATTAPYGTALARDARPPDSQTPYAIRLSAANSAAGGFACTNRLRFDFLAPPDSNRTYLVRVHLDGRYTADSADYNAVADLRTVANAGGWLALPPLARLSNGVVYGSCDVAARIVDRTSSNCVLTGLASGRTQATVRVRAQLGTRVRDVVEGCVTNLAATNAWAQWGVLTNDVGVDLASFDAGFRDLSLAVTLPAPTNAPARHFRVRRSWLAP